MAIGEMYWPVRVYVCCRVRCSHCLQLCTLCRTWLTNQVAISCAFALFLVFLAHVSNNSTYGATAEWNVVHTLPASHLSLVVSKWRATLCSLCAGPSTDPLGTRWRWLPVTNIICLSLTECGRSARKLVCQGTATATTVTTQSLGDIRLLDRATFCVCPAWYRLLMLRIACWTASNCKSIREQSLFVFLVSATCAQCQCCCPSTDRMTRTSGLTPAPLVSASTRKHEH